MQFLGRQPKTILQALATMLWLAGPAHSFPLSAIPATLRRRPSDAQVVWCRPTPPAELIAIETGIWRTRILRVLQRCMPLSSEGISQGLGGYSKFRLASGQR